MLQLSPAVVSSSVCLGSIEILLNCIQIPLVIGPLMRLPNTNQGKYICLSKLTRSVGCYYNLAHADHWIGPYYQLFSLVRLVLPVFSSRLSHC